jgi:hypothetical protein
MLRSTGRRILSEEASLCYIVRPCLKKKEKQQKKKPKPKTKGWECISVVEHSLSMQ